MVKMCYAKHRLYKELVVESFFLVEGVHHVGTTIIIGKFVIFN